MGNFFLDLVPGLYFLALAAALLWGLRRWFDPVPWRPALAFALVLGLFFAPVLVGGRILLPLTILRSVAPFRTLPPDTEPEHHLSGDLVRQIAPWQLSVRRAFEDGRWPLWNPHVGAGMPLLADPQSQALQPLVTVVYPLEFFAGIGVTAALRVLLALVFFYLLLRRQRLSEPAALTGSLAYGCGTFLLLWLGWPIANAAAWLPVVLYALARLSALPEEEPSPPGSVQEQSRDRPFLRRDLALLVFAAAALLLAGHPETALYAAALSSLFALARARNLWQRSRRTGLRFLSACTLCAGLAVGLAAPVLLPAAQFLPTTARSAQAANALAPRPLAELWHELRQPGTLAFWRVRATERLLPVAAPRAFGDADRFWGRDNLIEQTSGFVGSAALLAALASVFTLFARHRLPQERLFGGVLLVCLLLVAQPPGFDRLIGGLPVLGPTALHKHHRTLLLISAALAYLAACQVERTVRGRSRPWPVLLGTGVLAALLSWAYLRARPPIDPPVAAFPPGFWLSLQLALVAAAALLLLWPRFSRGLRLSRAAPWALAALVAGELVFLSWPVNLACSRHLAYPETATSRFLARNLGSARMVGLSSAFLPNFASVSKIADVRIDNPSQPLPYAAATSLVSQPGQIVPVFSQPRHPLYDLLGVRYVVTPAGRGVPLPLVQATAEAWIYERPRALPLLFLPEGARIFRGGDWRRFLERNRHFGRRALVAPSPGAEEDWRASAAPSALALTRFTPARLSARARLAERRLVASGLYHDGHWRALVDGKPVPLLWSNGPFAALWLPAGEHEVELLYRPAAFVIGCLLAAVALTLALALFVHPPDAILERTAYRSPPTVGNSTR